MTTPVPDVGAIRHAPDGAMAIYTPTRPHDPTPWLLLNHEGRYVMRIVTEAVADWITAGHLYDQSTASASPAREFAPGDPIPDDVRAVIDRHGEVWLDRDLHAAGLTFDEVSRTLGPLVEVPVTWLHKNRSAPGQVAA